MIASVLISSGGINDTASATRLTARGHKDECIG
jgi:hypothetical protein